MKRRLKAFSFSLSASWNEFSVLQTCAPLRKVQKVPPESERRIITRLAQKITPEHSQVKGALIINSGSGLQTCLWGLHGNYLLKVKTQSKVTQRLVTIEITGMRLWLSKSCKAPLKA